MADIILGTALKIALALVTLGVFDYAYQRWKHERNLRMTPQEVREEMKNLQGDPQVTSRRRQLQRQLAMRRSTAAELKSGSASNQDA
jgi:flagellar biosynthesis protein FlhB